MRLSASLALFAGLFLCLKAQGFPDMGRLGYSSCQSCHVSPSGGGVLNKYGRTMSSEVLGTLSWEDSGQLFFGLAPLPKFLDIGGDVRTVRLEARTPDFQIQRSFLMQADLEVAGHLGKMLTFTALAGVYGNTVPFDDDTELELEHRRYYALFRPKRDMTIRAGRFFPAYGLMIADHSAPIRGGLWWPQGAETYNLEIGVYREFGEFIITMARDPGETGIPSYQTGRLVAYVGSNSNVGISYYSDEEGNESIGIHSVWGWTKKLWTMAEFDTKTVDFETDGILWMSTSWEAFRGLVGSVKYHAQIQGEEVTQTAGLGLQWFPMPHYEISVDSYAREEYESYILISHYYF